MITPAGSDRYPRRDFGATQRRDRGLIAAAAGWGALLVILAIVAPVESVNTGRPGVQPMRSIVAVHGYGLLPVAAVPLLTAIVVGILLLARPYARWAVIAGWFLAGALLLAGLVGAVTFLIGIYALPTAVLLIVALSFAARAPSGPAGPR